MGKKLVAVLLLITLLLTMCACDSAKKKEEEQEKAKQEEIKKDNEAKANAFVSAIESLPELNEIRLKDEPAVAGARALYDELTEDQKALVPPEMVETLESAEERVPSDPQ